MPENFKWPKNGFCVVLAEQGKFWAATVDPHFLKELDTKSAEELFEQYFRPAIHHLKQMASDARKEALADICKKQVRRKLAEAIN